MTYTLLVSNPPHGNVNAEAAAKVLQLAPAEARMKANYVAPEIWLANPDRAKIEAAARQLGEAGLRTTVIAAGDLHRVPQAASATSCGFTDDHLEVVVGGTQLALPYDTPAWAVYSKPQASAAARPSRSTSSASALGRPTGSVVIGAFSGPQDAGTGTEETEPTFLDLYARIDGVERRISLVQGVVSVEKEQAGSPRITRLVEECQARFTALTVDRRMENLRIRSRLMVGTLPPEGAEKRKLFSFGSKALHELLKEISPDLTGMTQPELGSRLSYLGGRQAVA